MRVGFLRRRGNLNKINSLIARIDDAFGNSQNPLVGSFRVASARASGTGRHAKIGQTRKLCREQRARTLLISGFGTSNRVICQYQPDKGSSNCGSPSWPGVAAVILLQRLRYRRQAHANKRQGARRNWPPPCAGRMVERTSPATRRMAKLNSAAEKKSRFAIERGLGRAGYALWPRRPGCRFSFSSFCICRRRQNIRLAGPHDTGAQNPAPQHSLQDTVLRLARPRGEVHRHGLAPRSPSGAAKI